MTSPAPETLAEVERMLPCKHADNCGHHGDTGLCHWGNCPARYRPAVAQAVQSLKDSNAELRGALSQMSNAGGDCIDRIAQLEGELAGMTAAKGHKIA